MSIKLGPSKIIKQTNKINTGTVILFHGSGDSGPGLLKWIKSLVGNFSFPHLKFLFPTAPLRHYSLMHRQMSRVWFERRGITPRVPEHIETIDSMNVEIKKLIDTEIKNGIQLNKIIIGGFSMGGALALHTAYRNIPGFAGVCTLSSFLNDNSRIFEALQETSKGIETPLIMFHGNNDTLVLQEWGKTTYEKLLKIGVKGEFHEVEDCLHELKKSEICQLFAWINKVLPENK